MWPKQRVSTPGVAALMCQLEVRHRITATEAGRDHMIERSVAQRADPDSRQRSAAQVAVPAIPNRDSLDLAPPLRRSLGVATDPV